jgi:hypothetical protein
LTEKKKRDEKMFGKTKKLLDYSDIKKMREKKDVEGLIKALRHENKGVFARKPRKPLVGSAMSRLW